MNSYTTKNLLRKATFTLLFAGFMLNSNLAQAIIFENVLVNGKTKAVACANKPIIISSGNMYENNIKGGGVLCPPSNIAGQYVVIYKGPYLTEFDALSNVINTPIDPGLNYPSGFIGGNMVSQAYNGPFPLTAPAPSVSLNLTHGYYAVQTYFRIISPSCPTQTNFVAGEGSAIILRATDVNDLTTNVTAYYQDSNTPVGNPLCFGQSICFNIDIDDNDQYGDLNSLIGSTFSFGVGLPVLTFTVVEPNFGHHQRQYFWIDQYGEIYNHSFGTPRPSPLCYTYPNAFGNYNATLVQNDPCKNTEIIPINVVNSLASLNAQTNCNSKTVVFTHVIGCSAGAPILWNFGDGSIETISGSSSGTTIVNHNYLNNGTYNITASVGNITVSKTITIDQITIPAINGSIKACGTSTSGGELYSASIADFFDANRQYSYAWSVTGGIIDNSTPATGSFSPTTQPLNLKINWTPGSPNLGGTVTLNVTNSTGCVYSKTVNVEPCCNLGTVISVPTNISKLIALNPNLGTNSTFSVNAPLIIDKSFTCSGCKFIMGESQTIELTPGTVGPINTEFQLVNSNVYACDKMWDYILAPNPNTQIRIENTFIEDGKNAIQSKNGGSIIAFNSTFNKNLNAIVLNNSTSPNNSPLIVYGNTFTCKSGITQFTKPGVTLRAPFNTKIGFSGITFVDVKMANVGDRAHLLNTFEVTQYGIYSINSGLIIKNNLFQDIVQPKNTKERYIAIYSKGDIKVPTGLIVGGNLKRENNTFLNCDYGIVAENNNDLYIAYNSFNNIKSYAINYFKNTDKEDVKILYNNFTDVSVGVFAYNNLISTNLINNNSFIQSAHGAGIYAGEVAVLISEPSKSASSVYTINNNTIKWFAEGIHLSLVQGAKVNNNTIRLDANDQGYGYGVYAEYNTLLTAHNNNVVYMGTSAKPYYKGFYIATTTNSTYTCNSAEKLEDGFYFEEDNNGTVLKTTSFSRNINHLHISGNSGLIGQQGSLYISASNKAKVNDNNFTPGFGNVNQTYTSNSAIGGNSKFYVRSSPFQLNPSQNNFDLGQGTRISPTTYTNSQIAHPRLNCNVVLPPPGGLANGGNRDLAHKIAKGLINYPLQAAGNQQSKQNLLEALKAEPSFAAGDTVLTQFNDSMQLAPWGQMTQALALMADSTQIFDSARVAQANTIVQAQNANTVMETNFKQVNQIWLQALQNNTQLDSAQQQTIRTMAWLCPITEGPAVYQARAIIHAYDSVYVNYRNACEAYSAPIVYARGVNQEETANDDNLINNNIEAETLYSQVYPNPTTNAFNVAILTNTPQNVSVSVYNMMGELIETQETVTNSKAISFNLQGYAQGLYLCKITNQNGEVLETKKVFIQHD